MQWRPRLVGAAQDKNGEANKPVPQHQQGQEEQQQQVQEQEQQRKRLLQALTTHREESGDEHLHCFNMRD